MHYGHDAILEIAKPMKVNGEPDPHWKEARIVLAEGDTAYAPGTTKKEFSGKGEIVYAISATGWMVEKVADGIFVQHRGG